MNRIMNTNIEKLLHHRKIHFSQNGEDGFLDFVLSKLPEKTNWCIEFGAWDGKHLSNTHYFITEKGYKSVLIEGEADRCEVLSKNMGKYGAICINQFVDFQGKNTLDNILAKTPIPKNFDLLSIDIDGDDYQVWQSIKNYQPKVVIIEINIRDKPTVERINLPGSPYVWGLSGTSIKSMTELAVSKGYSLIANISCNAIYVKDEYLKLFHDKRLTPEEAFLFEGHKYHELTEAEKKHLGLRRVFIKYLKHCYRKTFPLRKSNN